MDIFKNLHSFEKRNSECGRILKKHPERIPVVVCKGDKEKTLQDIDKQKYLVPQDMTIGQFVYIIRKRIKLKLHVNMSFLKKVKTFFNKNDIAEFKSTLE